MATFVLFRVMTPFFYWLSSKVANIANFATRKVGGNLGTGR
jgi:hypothetical protein